MLDKVIANGYCVGCGACAALSPEKYRMQLDADGKLQAFFDEGVDESGQAPQVCPFSDQAKNEDELAAIFLKDSPLHHEKIGRFIECYAGRVTDGEVYEKSSSGGIARWILAELLRRGDVDAVLHVIEQSPTENEAPAGASPFPLYSYAISTEPETVLNTARSAYYPIEMSQMIRLVLDRPGRYAITGLPCFIKTVRNIALIHPIFRERIRYTIGIVCGHLKSTFYAEMIGWQLGVAPSRLQGLDFRVKIPGKQANEKGVSARSPDNAISPAKTVQELFGTSYGHGYFKYSACDYCDDVLGETADVSIGDAWLPEFLAKGTSAVVVRNETIRQIIEEGRRSCALTLKTLTADDVARSQDAGLRHRREGLAYRLALKHEEGAWAPAKRVAPQKNHLSQKQQRIFRLRVILAKASFEHFRQAKVLGDWHYFKSKMLPLNQAYADAYASGLRATLAYRALRKVYRTVKAIFGK